eukprot:SAG31_NODE_5169_length_2702_cov_1.711103_2_plen_85_part_00
MERVPQPDNRFEDRATIAFVNRRLPGEEHYSAPLHDVPTSHLLLHTHSIGAGSQHRSQPHFFTSLPSTGSVCSTPALILPWARI